MLKFGNLMTTSKPENMFNAVLKGINDNNINLKIFLGTSTDATPSMISEEDNALKFQLCQLNYENLRNPSKRDLSIIHYLIRKQNLCARVISINHIIEIVMEKIHSNGSYSFSHIDFEYFLRYIESEYDKIEYVVV